MEDIRRQERKEQIFRRGELPERFIVRKLYRWIDKKYDKEYWTKLERNWRYWKEDRIREQKTMETIKEKKEEIDQKNSRLREQTEENNDKMGNIRDPYNKL